MPDFQAEFDLKARAFVKSLQKQLVDFADTWFSVCFGHHKPKY